MLNVVGKLKAGVTIEQARAELETIRARAAVANPEYPGNRMALRLVPAGLLLAKAGLSLVLTLVPYAIPRLIESSIDGPVLSSTSSRHRKFIFLTRKSFRAALRRSSARRSIRLCLPVR